MRKKLFNNNRWMMATGCLKKKLNNIKAHIQTNPFTPNTIHILGNALTHLTSHHPTNRLTNIT